jgi:hypothetical protein
MGEPNNLLLHFLLKNFNVDTFVETGSAHGGMTVKACGLFSSVYTVELNTALFNETSQKVKGRANCRNGKSVDFLKELLPTIKDKPIIYWLDAHYSGDETSGIEEQCSLLDEIKIINSRREDKDFIFIDDAHTFFSPAILKAPHDVDQFPNIVDIFKELDSKDKYTVILTSWKYLEEHKKIVMIDDSIVSVPKWAKEEVYQWIKTMDLECTV